MESWIDSNSYSNNITVGEIMSENPRPLCPKCQKRRTAKFRKRGEAKWKIKCWACGYFGELKE